MLYKTKSLYFVRKEPKGYQIIVDSIDYGDVFFLLSKFPGHAGMEDFMTWKVLTINGVIGYFLVNHDLEKLTMERLTDG